MAFPETPLPVLVDISLNGSTWTDVTGDVRADAGIEITTGRSDWGQSTDPGRCSFVLDNRDGKYSPRNPQSPYFGQIGRNTPVRVSVATGDKALWLPGLSSANTIFVSDNAQIDVTGDIDVRIDATLLNWNLADGPIGNGSLSLLTEIFGKYDTNGNNRSWTLYTQNGHLVFAWSEDGSGSTGYTVTCSDELPVPVTGRIAVRVTLDVNNGSGGFDVKFYTSDTIDGVWTQLGNTETGGATTSIYNSTALLQIGNGMRGPSWTPPKGYVHAAEVRNGIDGTLVANPIFSEAPEGTADYTDGTGMLWRHNDSLTEVTTRKVRFVGEISSWTPQWDTGGFDVTTRVEASGVLRRLSQGVVAAKSPAYREFTSPFRQNIVAYWPMEDGSDATSFASAIDGHPPMKIAGTVNPGAYSDWVASEPVATIGTGSIKVNVPAYTATSYIFTRFFTAVPAGGVPAEQRLFSFTQSGTARHWSLFLSTAGSLALKAYDTEGAEILNTGYFSFAVNGKKTSCGVELTQSGSNINYRVITFDCDASALNSPSALAINGTLNNYTVGRITQIRFGEDGLMNDTAIGHMAIADDSNAYASTTNALIGWNGERAAARIHRLGAEENISAYTTAFGDQQMGVQSRDVVLDLMRKAEEVDQGILCEQRDILGVKLVQRQSLYNQTPTLVLDYSGSDGLVAPLDPVEDDQTVTNDVTVTREGGSFHRSILSDGPLSNQEPPNGVGVYDTAYTFGLFSDDQLPYHSGWLLHQGTWDETRYPQVTVDLANAPESIPAAVLTHVGCRVQITNPPPWLPPNTIDLMVLGYSEKLSHFEWTITYNCAPYGPYNVAYEASSPQSLYTHVDTDGSELASAIDADDTQLTIKVTDGPEWVMASPVINGNYDFETDLTNWFGNGATIERVRTPGIPPFLGEWSMKITPDGVAQYPNAGSDLIPVTPGTTYTTSAWQMCETTRSCDLNINWFDASFNYLSTASHDEAMTAGEWVWFQNTATAPVGAAYINIAPTVPDFPPSTDVLYTDMITLRKTISEELSEDFPFDVTCNGEIMRVTACTRSVFDTFGRTETNGWGTADSGQTWTTSGGTAADYSVSGSAGHARLSTTNSHRVLLAPAPSADIDLYVDVTTSATATGASIFGGPVVRAVNNDNLYHARLEFTTANAVTVWVRKRVGGVDSAVGSLYTAPFTHTPGTSVRIRFQVDGSNVRVKLWQPSRPEPGQWQIDVTDSDLTAANNVGFRSFSSTGNTNVNPLVSYSNYKITNPQIFTVTRSVNGITKSHAAGSDVRLTYPAITAL